MQAAVGGVAASMARPLRARPNDPFEINLLRPGYLRRIDAIRRVNTLPILDIESSYNPYQIDLAAFTRAMDKNGVALMALSVNMPGGRYNGQNRWSHHAFELVRDYPQHFLPTGNGGVDPAWTRHPEAFLDDNEAFIIAHRYPLMGEFEFRHYPSPRQIERREFDRDVTVPIDGPHGHRLFAFAERTGVPFQIHYEIEDELLAPLEAMLARYPKAKVIWCHFAQIRYGARAKLYGPRYLADLFERHPNLYVDTAFGGPNAIYKPSGERHARYWSDTKAWLELIEAWPYRFLAALDIGGDRMNRLDEWSINLRHFLDTIPGKARQIVACGAAWKLLFGEEIVA
jgi:predicted TIM-barrel fold metal-dependent hydrolase